MASSYAEAYPDYVPDTRHRGRVSIAHVLPPSRDISRRAGFSIDLVFSSILGKSVLALGLHLTKEWLLAPANGTGVDPLISVGEAHWRLLAIAAFFLSIWHRPWELFSKRINYTRLLTYSTLICAESYAYMTALDKLPVLRLVMLSEASQLWTHGFQSMRRKSSSTARNANFVAVATIAIAYIAELYLNKRISKTSVNTGYLAVLCYLFLKATATDTLRSLSPNPTSLDEESQSRYHSLGMAMSVPIALLFSVIPTSSVSTIESTSSLPTQTLLSTLALLAFALFVADPILNSAVNRRTVTIKGFKGIWPISSLAVAFIGVTAFQRTLHIADFVIGSIAYWGISHILHSDPRLVAEAAGKSVTSFVNGHVSTSRSKGKETVLESIERQYRQIRATIKTILENPDSKKIYYFLCLNLAFMFVQMMYGIWTNSLGLISDSIHMFFDCLALAMGLLASVMATWPRNETFTYGYVRVETLSGFANGVFLVLISIFIVFEAIQRLIDPPEMNTNQLLTVSVLGLAVNLVGMFATGHHHHGHSHGHDHSGHDHGHGHSHGHSHNMHGVFLHVMADTLGSVGVIVSTLLINRYGWTGFDPIASIFIAVLIFASVIPLIMDSAQLLCLDLGSDKEKDVRTALAKLSNVEGLSSYGAARFWPKDPSTVVGSIHIQLAPSPSHDHRPSNGMNGGPNLGLTHYASAEKVVKRVESVLKGAIDGLVELSVQVEPTEGDISCPCMVSAPR